MADKGIFKSLGNRIPLSQKVATKIEEAILNKELCVGEKLPSEHELCNQFEVSRTSVREAIKILVTQGIVEVEKGRGIFVKNLSSQSVTDGILKFYQHRLEGEYALELVHTRQALEPSIAYYAALNRTEEDIEMIEGIIKALNKHNNSPELSAKYDLEFHKLLAIASKNKMFLLMMEPLQGLIPQVKRRIHAVLKNSTDVAMIWHDKIFEAIKLGNAKEAKDCMIEHLKIAEKQIINVYKAEKQEKEGV